MYISTTKGKVKSHIVGFNSVLFSERKNIVQHLMEIININECVFKVSTQQSDQ